MAFWDRLGNFLLRLGQEASKTAEDVAEAITPPPAPRPPRFRITPGARQRERDRYTRELERRLSELTETNERLQREIRREQVRAQREDYRERRRTAEAARHERTVRFREAVQSVRASGEVPAPEPVLGNPGVADAQYERAAYVTEEEAREAYRSLLDSGVPPHLVALQYDPIRDQWVLYVAPSI